MTRLRTSLRDYLKMRRGLGFKLHEPGKGLLDFVTFMERKRASRITTKLALYWAQKPKTVRPAEWARRLSWVRGFARYQSAIDPRTEIPPEGLLPYRPQRARPYIYTVQEIKGLLAAARSLPPAGGLRSWRYYCLLGLLSVTGLRLGEALNLKLDDSRSGSPRPNARTWQWKRRVSTGSLSGTYWPTKTSSWCWRMPHISRTCPAARATSKMPMDL